MRTRNWSIRSKIIAMVAVPLTALLALWVFATALTAGPARTLLSAQTLVDSVGNPGERLIAELQVERRLSVAYLSGDPAGKAALTAQRVSTDTAAADFRRSAGAGAARSAADETLRLRIRQVFSDLDSLAANRLHIDRREVDPVGAQNLYNAMAETGFQMFAATATFGDERIDRKIRAVVTIARGQEYLSRMNSLVGGALAAGELSPQGRADLLQSIGTARFLLAQGVNDLTPADRSAYQRLSTSPAFTRLGELQDDILTDSRPGAAVPVREAEWRPTYDTAAQQLIAFEVNAIAALPGEATPVAVDVLVRLGLAGLLGLLAFIISIFVSARVGRSMVGRLTRLRGEALEMAGERLPTVVRRLQRGEAVDVEVETPPLEYGRDEIGQLGQAFNDVQRTAVQSAVEEASVRRGINEVFLNIARRSQTLLHRQLALLDKMERRETEPDELEDLYRVDHLATRMRRHAEDLVILAGAAPGRGWRNPVPVIDVVRGAISEVEDYKRVDIVSVASSSVLGRAVGDVIHLLAELLENAASFSPPQTRVQVVGQVLPNGYALEIEDRGLGMSAAALDEANRRLLEPPDFDPTDSARLGLFVVAQLANRHGIRVSLRRSGYGGVTAVVLVPGELVTHGRSPVALPVGTTPPGEAWEQPLVGTGTEDPARSSLAALQWQGAEELRSIAVTGRPVAVHGTATPSPARQPMPDRAERTRPLSRQSLGRPSERATLSAEPVGGPAPSAVADGLTADGLVQRRRTRPRQERDGAAAAPAMLPPNLSSPAALTSDFPSVGNGRTTNGGALSGAGLNGGTFGSEGLADAVFGGDAFRDGGSAAGGFRRGEQPARPRVPSPRVAPEAVPLIGGRPVEEPAGAETVLDEPLLPRRVRQANLAPQLRAPVEEQAEARLRSPEHVRSLMSALQQGTTRGRRDAAGLGPTAVGGEVAGRNVGATSDIADDQVGEGTGAGQETDKDETVEGPIWSQAATVIFPAVQDPVAAGSDDSIDYAPENHEHQRDKDA